MYVQFMHIPFSPPPLSPQVSMFTRSGESTTLFHLRMCLNIVLIIEFNWIELNWSESNWI